MDTSKNERIFISYKRVDKDRVFELKNEIEQSTGEKCWIDLDGIESDAQFADVIMNAIDRCDIFLFMRSKAHNKLSSNNSDWTIREVNYALNQNKRIIFVDLDNSPWPRWFKFMFPNKQEIDANDSTRLEKLYQDLQLWLQNIDNGLPIDTESEEVSQKTFLEKTKEVISYIFGIPLGFAMLYGIGWIPFALYGCLIAPKCAEKGNSYFYGTLDIPQDYTRAVKIYKWGTGGSRRTNPKYAQAAYNLAQCYENGWGTAIDQADAFKTYEKAAKRDHTHAMCKVAQCYIEGTLGCEKDTTKAKKWYLKAIELGNEEAKERLEQLQSN